MAHPQQQEFVAQLRNRFPHYFNNNLVLEIGSLNINGSIRVLFKDCRYTGIDVGPGPGVDIVCPGEEFKGANGDYDVVASTECFEHAHRWNEIFENMVRMTRRGGLVFFTCAGLGRGEHGTRRSAPDASPHTADLDYYQNLTPQDFMSRFNLGDMFSQYAFEINRVHCDLYFYGIRV